MLHNAIPKVTSEGSDKSLIVSWCSTRWQSSSRKLVSHMYRWRASRTEDFLLQTLISASLISADEFSFYTKPKRIIKENWNYKFAPVILQL